MDTLKQRMAKSLLMKIVGERHGSELEKIKDRSKTLYDAELMVRALEIMELNPIVETTEQNKSEKLFDESLLELTDGQKGRPTKLQ
ncbi:MAG: hypothetical protein WAV41_00850 [Microgenomates group bacterium]